MTCRPASRQVRATSKCSACQTATTAPSSRSFSSISRIIGVGALDAVRFGGLGQDIGTEVRRGDELRFGVGEDGGEVGGRRPPPGADDADSCLVSHGDLGFGKKGWVF